MTSVFACFKNKKKFLGYSFSFIYPPSSYGSDEKMNHFRHAKYLAWFKVKCTYAPLSLVILLCAALKCWLNIYMHFCVWKTIYLGRELQTGNLT